MKKIILSIIALSALASCQKVEEQSLELDGSSVVSFTSGISTRVSGTSWESTDQIGVFMYATGLTDLYDYYGSNVLYTISSGAETESAKFSSENPLYYPQGASMDFVAYYPYTTIEESSTAIAINTSDQSSAEKMNALDLMVARATNCTEATSPTLTFSRKMSKVVFDVTCNDTAEYAELSNFSLSNIVSDGTLTIVNISEISVSKGTTQDAISLFMNDSDNIEAIIVPQTTTDAKIAFSVDNDTYYGTVAETFEAGKVYTYTLVVGQAGVEISGVTISDWGENVSSGDLTLTDDITYYASEISASNVPAKDTWTIIDEGEMTVDLMEGVRAALNVATDAGRSIKIILPNATSIGYYAFDFRDDDQGNYSKGISALTDIEMPNVTEIGSWAFAWCGFTSFDFEEIETIGNSAFNYCTNLTELINFNYTTIPNGLFAGCGLTSFDFDGITEVGESAFASCENLTEVFNFNYTTIPTGLFHGCGFTSFDFTGVTEIGISSFGGCIDLTEIELPSTVTSIGIYAFYNTGITTVTLNWTGTDDEILTYSSDDCWFYGSPLSEIHIPYGTTDAYKAKGWPEDLLVEPYKASEISASSVPAKDTWTIIDEGEMTQELMEGVRAALNVATDDDRSIKIILPNATSIGAYAFDFSDDDQGDYSKGVSALTDIEMPDVTAIGSNAFVWCGFTSFDFEGIKTIGTSALSYCTNLTEVINCTTISDFLFKGSGLTSFDFEGITDIGEGAFSQCENLTEVFNFNLTTIPEGLFSNSALTSFDFTGVEEIGYISFLQCWALTEIELPSTVTSIGYWAFFNSAVTTVILNWTGDQIIEYDGEYATGWFTETSLSEIHIPYGTTDAYVAKGWPEDLLVEKAQ